MVRGRKPRATEVKEREGAFRKDPQRRNKNEPKFTPGAPKCPDLVSGDMAAFAAWNHTVEVLSESGVLTHAEKALLVLYSTTYSQWLKVYLHVRENGYSVTSHTGNESTSPEAHAYHKLSDRLLRLIIEMGLTPSARSRLVVKGKEEESPMAALLERMTSRN